MPEPKIPIRMRLEVLFSTVLRHLTVRALSLSMPASHLDYAFLLSGAPNSKHKSMLRMMLR